MAARALVIVADGTEEMEAVSITIDRSQLKMGFSSQRLFWSIYRI